MILDQKVKIGSKAIPITGREQHSLIEGWSAPDLTQTIKGITSLVKGDAHGFGVILKTEWPSRFDQYWIKSLPNWYQFPTP